MRAIRKWTFSCELIPVASTAQLLHCKSHREVGLWSCTVWEISICLYDSYDCIYQSTWSVSPYDFFLTESMVSIVFALWEVSFISFHISIVMNGNLGTDSMATKRLCSDVSVLSVSYFFAFLLGEYMGHKLHHLWDIKPKVQNLYWVRLTLLLPQTPLFVWVLYIFWPPDMPKLKFFLPFLAPMFPIKRLQIGSAYECWNIAPSCILFSQSSPCNLWKQEIWCYGDSCRWAKVR